MFVILLFSRRSKTKLKRSSSIRHAGAETHIKTSYFTKNQSDNEENCNLQVNLCGTHGAFRRSTIQWNHPSSFQHVCLTVDQSGNTVSVLSQWWVKTPTFTQRWLTASINKVTRPCSFLIRLSLRLSAFFTVTFCWPSLMSGPKNDNQEDQIGKSC